MAHLLQGDIFTVTMERQCDLAVVFGHVGMNEMGVEWRQSRGQTDISYPANPSCEVN